MSLPPPVTGPSHRPHGESAEALALRSPDAILGALPYLLGFTPQESLVIVWIGRRRLLLTQRLDLAGALVDPVGWRTAIWEHAVARSADEVIAVLVTEDLDPEAIASDFTERAAVAGVGVRDVIVTGAGRWRSLLCQDPACCPPEGRPVDQSTASALAAEFTIRGIAPMPDRSALVRELAEDSERTASMRPLVEAALARIPSSRRPHEAWRDATIDHLMRCLGLVRAPRASEATALSHDDCAEVMSALEDIRVRDTLLWECARTEQADLDRAMGHLVACLRSAPAGHVAPIATACAVVAWLLGDGARATIAVERALLDRPGYTLAVLVLQSLRAGLPPASWREAMGSVARDECRHGLSSDRRAG